MRQAIDMRMRKMKLRYKAVGTSLAGKGVSAISSNLRIPSSTVRFWLSKFRNCGDVEDRARTGRPKATSPTADRRIVRMCKANRFASSSMLHSDWGESVSSRTLRNRLNVKGYYSRKPIRKPKLSPTHMAARLSWAMTKCHFREQQWSRIVFTDESRFLLYPMDGRLRTWRCVGERNASYCTAETVSYGGGSVHVWAAISATSKSELVILHRNVNQETYKVVLRDHLLPWATANLGEPERDWRLQEDNAPAHRARSVEEEKQRLGIPRSIPWPSRSPDLNPIEHAWNSLGRRMQQRATQPTKLVQLACALKEEWLRISQDEIKKPHQHAPENKCGHRSQRRPNEVLTSIFENA